MTAAEYADLLLSMKTEVVSKLRTELPNETEVIDRFIFSGVRSEDEWVAALQNEDNRIRKCIVLIPSLDLGSLATTNVATFAPTAGLSIELYHDYLMGTDANNTQTGFDRDCAIIHYVLGKYRALPGQTVIQSANLTRGLRPSQVQTLHMMKGRVSIDMRNVRYN